METIEEAAVEYCNKEIPFAILANERIDCRKHFKAGAEFAQQWISVDVEPPTAGMRVLLKSKTGYIETRTIKSSDFDSAGTLQVYHGKNRVSHWRMIELK